jgi:hypothetical protein
MIVSVMLFVKISPLVLRPHSLGTEIMIVVAMFFVKISPHILRPHSWGKVMKIVAAMLFVKISPHFAAMVFVKKALIFCGHVVWDQ